MWFRRTPAERPSAPILSPEQERADEKRRIREEQDRREQNVAHAFLAALLVGILGLLIFAAAVNRGALIAFGRACPEAKAADASSTTTTTSAAPPTITKPDGEQPITGEQPAARQQPAASASPAKTEGAGKGECDGSGPSGVRVFGLSILAGGAAGLVGALLGFLFGLPRSPMMTRATNGAGGTATATGRDAGAGSGEGAAPEAAPGGPSGTPNGSTPSDPAVKLVTNNNLTEIADWLAKVIVGAGLVGLKDLTRWIGRKGALLGVGAGLGEGLAGAYGTSIIMYFFTLGFLFAYINTRTVISLMLAGIDRSLLDQMFGRVEARVDRRVEEKVDQRYSEERQVQDDKNARLEFSSADNAITALLYSTERGAAGKAAELAENYLKRNPENGRVWLLLACAYGQMHQVADQSTKKDLENKAYDAVRNALRFDPNQRGFLRRLMETENASGDDDLTSLAAADPRFLALLDDTSPATPPPSQPEPPKPG